MQHWIQIRPTMVNTGIHNSRNTNLNRHENISCSGTTSKKKCHCNAVTTSLTMLVNFANRKLKLQKWYYKRKKQIIFLKGGDSTRMMVVFKFT